MPIKHFVEAIASDPWRRHYRQEPFGGVIKGWVERLSNFGLNSSPIPSLASHLYWVHHVTALAAQYDPENPALQTLGIGVGAHVLDWGGVTKSNLERLPSVLASVVIGARTGKPDTAPMNSGWTKIAAVFSYLHAGSPPQVIWDSRVSLSVCARLGRWATCAGLHKWQISQKFPDLGWVPGRGGNRDKLQCEAQKWFPNRNGKWLAHFGGGRFVQEVSDYLNKNQPSYGKPEDALASEERNVLSNQNVPIPREWTPWLVACVLFMDGY